ncbi:MAG: YqgE/AlgH family protein [Stellaceae bacterium]
MSSAFDQESAHRKRASRGAWAALAAIAAAWCVAAPRPGAAQQEFLTGQFLIAAPSMGDPRFYHAVIFVVRHDKEGALGIVVNRPVESEPLRRLLEDLGEPGSGASGKVQIFAGGPVQPKVGFVLHSAEYRRAGTLAIDGKVAMSSSPAVLRDIASGRGPRKYILAFGYAGWGPGQLEAELGEQAWFTAPDDPTLLFDADRATLWQAALERRSRAL